MSSTRAFAAACSVGFVLSACSAGSSLPNASAAANAVPSAPTLDAARRAVCITPATSAQTVMVPETGGITASVIVGAFDASASGCDQLTVATGTQVDDAVSGQSFEGRSVLARNALAATPRPLFSITAGETSSGENFGFATIVNGVTLATSPDLHFPDGEYPAVVSATLGGETFPVHIVFTARNGVLTLTGLTAPLILHSRASIYVYAPGVTPPASVSPSPSPQASSSAWPTVAVTPTARPITTPIPGITRYGAPPAPDGSVIGTYTAAFAGTTCSHDPNPCGAGPNTQLTQGGDYQGQARMYIPSGFFGTITYTLSDISNPYVQFSSNCPASWQISQAIDGGSIVIPASVPYSGDGHGDATKGGCILTQNTLPPGKSGTYYTQSIILQPTFS